MVKLDSEGITIHISSGSPSEEWRLHLTSQIALLKAAEAQNLITPEQRYYTLNLLECLIPSEDQFLCIEKGLEKTSV